MRTRREVSQHLCTALLSPAALSPTALTSTATAPPEAAAEEPRQRFLLIGLCGSENPTRANFPFAWGAALREAGHEVRIELAGDATVLMRTVVAASVIPVGWPPLSQAIAKVIEHKIPIFV
jgi:hypothetical protein